MMSAVLFPSILHRILERLALMLKHVEPLWLFFLRYIRLGALVLTRYIFPQDTVLLLHWHLKPPFQAPFLNHL